MKETLSSDDVIFFDFEISSKSALAVYVDSITDKMQLGDLVVRALRFTDSSGEIDELKKQAESPDCKTVGDFKEAVGKILAGSTLILIDGMTEGLLFDLKKFESRAVSEPPTSAVVKGPREGFTESIKTNLSLLRRRIQSEDLKIEYIPVGKYSKTQVAVTYIDSICDDDIVNQVKERIKSISIDGVPDSSYIAEQIVEHKASLFKQVGNTEKPDILMAKMLEGRVGIIVDGSPIAVTVPYLLIEDFQSSEDYFKTFYRSNMQRFVRLISIIIAIYLPAIFVAAQLFHLQLIPLNFLLTIVSSIKGIPLSPSMEMFFTLLIFEILNEASVRMPKYVGMALSVVGALVLGDTAVRAGIVSTPTIMIMALSGICLYTVPELVDSMSFLRLTFLIVAGSVGGYGIILVSAFLIIYLCSLENFGVPFLSPYAPIEPNDLKDGLYMTLHKNMGTRPLSLRVKNIVRFGKSRDKQDVKRILEHPDYTPSAGENSDQSMDETSGDDQNQNGESDNAEGANETSGGDQNQSGESDNAQSSDETGGDDQNQSGESDNAQSADEMGGGDQNQSGESDNAQSADETSGDEQSQNAESDSAENQSNNGAGGADDEAELED